MQTTVVSPSSPVNAGQRVILEPIKMTVEMLGILAVIHNTKTFSCSEVSKAWALSFKSYPKDKGSSSQSRVVQIGDSGMSGKLKKLRHDSGFLVSLEFQFPTVSIPLLTVFYKFVH